ncbi:hypothetical protein Tco_0648854 [Tanacetum coccineum]
MLQPQLEDRGLLDIYLKCHTGATYPTLSLHQGRRPLKVPEMSKNRSHGEGIVRLASGCRMMELVERAYVVIENPPQNQNWSRNCLAIPLPKAQDFVIVQGLDEAGKEDLSFTCKCQESLVNDLTRRFTYAQSAGFDRALLAVNYECEINYHPGKGSQRPPMMAKRISKDTLSTRWMREIYLLCIVSGFHQLVWWFGDEERDIAESFLAMSLRVLLLRIKVPNIRNPQDFVQQLSNFLSGNGKRITMDFVTKLPKSSSGHDTIWSLWIRLIQQAHGVPGSESFQTAMVEFTFTTYGKAFQKAWVRDRHVVGLPPLDRRWDNNSLIGVSFPMIIVTTQALSAHHSRLCTQKCRSPVIWTEVGESQLIGPEIMQETTEKIVQIKERLKMARSHQKYYCLNIIAKLPYCREVPIYHEPLIAIVVSASVVDRSIGTDNPHLSLGH